MPKSINIDSLKKEIEAVCAEGGRKEDMMFLIENSDNVRAKEIMRRLKYEKLEGCN